MLVPFDEAGTCYTDESTKYKENAVELSEDEILKNATAEVEALLEEGFDEEVEPANENEELAA